MISGERPVRETEGRTYQQVELPSGPFRRVVELSVDVDAERRSATYEDGILRVELPVSGRRGRRARSRSSGPTDSEPERRRRRTDEAEVETPQLEVVEIPDVEEAVAATRSRCPTRCPVLPLRETVTFPETLTPLAVGQERSIKLVNDVLSGNRMLAMVASKDPENDAPGPDDLYRVGVAGTVARMMKVPDGTLRILVQGGGADPRSRLRQRGALPGRPHRGGARTCSSRPPSSRR